MTITPELEAMVDAIDQERWNVAFQMVKGKTISDREASERLARAALMAIREPSRETRHAGGDAEYWPRSLAGQATACVTIGAAVAAWTAMIDHIAGEPS